MWVTLAIVCEVLFIYYLPHRWWVLSVYYILIPLPGSSPWVRKWTWWVFFSSIPQYKRKKKEDGVCIYAIHPHGLFGERAVPPFLLDNSVRFAGTSLILYLPIVRELASLLGYVKATKHSIVQTLKGGKSIVIVPGGLRDLLGHDPLSGPMGIWPIVYRRKGFIECALEANVPVVPIHVWVPPDDPLYWFWNPRVLRPMRSWLLKRFYYCWPTFAWGQPLLGFLPRQSGCRKIRYLTGTSIYPHGSLNAMQYNYYEQLDSLVRLSKTDTLQDSGTTTTTKVQMDFGGGEDSDPLPPLIDEIKKE